MSSAHQCEKEYVVLAALLVQYIFAHQFFQLFWPLLHYLRHHVSRTCAFSVASVRLSTHNYCCCRLLGVLKGNAPASLQSFFVGLCSGKYRVGWNCKLDKVYLPVYIDRCIENRSAVRSNELGRHLVAGTSKWDS